MRRCSYCGQEYAEGTTCPIDDHPLIDEQPAVSAEQRVEIESSKPVRSAAAPHLLYPEYRWSAADAWKAVFVIALLVLFYGVVLVILEHFSYGFHSWRLTGAGRVVTSALDYLIELSVVYYFARTETWQTIKEAFGLACKPTSMVWRGIAAAILIRLFEREMFAHHWARGVINHGFRGFESAVGINKFLFMIPPVLFAPILEECIYRGFLYKAFRGSYSVTLSTALIVGWTFWTHQSSYLQSGLAAFDLSLLTIVQCQLRERSASLWDTIFTHMVYNGWSYLMASIQSG